MEATMSRLHFLCPSVFLEIQCKRLVTMREAGARLLWIASLLASQTIAFTISPRLYARSFLSSTRTSTSLFESSSSNSDGGANVESLIVISPPGGVGEVAAVKAATMGASVRWFVVSPTTNSQVVLSQQALDQIQTGGGVVELAGADAPSLLLSEDDAKSAVQAVSAWCGTADSIVCTFDGTTAKVEMDTEQQNPLTVWKDAIKVAAQQASSSIRGKKLAILSLEEGIEEDSKEEEESGGLGSLVGGLLGGSKMQVPATLVSAMGASNIVTLRHGKLFGTPESSPEFSALAGGPRKEPELCEEYLTRTVRVDPSLSMSGNVMMGDTTRSSRHAVGEAAALMALGRIPTQPGLDVSVSSQRGTDPPTLDTWLNELERVNKALSSGAGAQLFSADFGSVPDINRLTGWLATKWAPTVLRTYDIAAIRKGARPVSANKIQDDKVEIVWQELVDFQTVTAGRMVVQVSDTGLVALRGPGDASKGFGEISRKPLQGEDVLVRRLAEAASQAIEKGLANKPKVQKEQAPKPKKAVAVTKPAPAVVSSLQSSGTVGEQAAESSSTGPRKAGARRSRERARGKKRKATTPSPPPE